MIWKVKVYIRRGWNESNEKNKIIFYLDGGDDMGEPLFGKRGVGDYVLAST